MRTMRSIIKHIIYSPRSSSSRRRNRVRESDYCETWIRDLNACVGGWWWMVNGWMGRMHISMTHQRHSFSQTRWSTSRRSGTRRSRRCCCWEQKAPFHSASGQRCCCSCYSSSSSCSSVEPCRQTEDTGTFGLSPVRSSSCSCWDSIKYFVCRLIHFWAIWFRFNKATFKWPLCGQGESTTAPDQTRQAK